MRRHSFRISAALVGTLGVCCALPALAEDLPSNFVTADMCMSRPCTCADIPFVEVFLQNQKDARAAFESIYPEIWMTGGPSNVSDVQRAFAARFPGDPRVLAQYKTCPGYDPSVNSAKFAGVDNSGTAKIDECACAAFCQDIVDATIAHERTHPPTLIIGFLARLPGHTACKVGALPDSMCDMLTPIELVESEIAAYTVGINVLESDLNDLKAEDPSMPEMACTWQPLPSATASAAPLLPEQTPQGLFDRIVMLLERIIWGREQTEELAVLDAHR